jgi:hypothetical protein
MKYSLNLSVSSSSFFVSVQGTEPVALYMLDKSSTTEQSPSFLISSLPECDSLEGPE